MQLDLNRYREAFFEEAADHLSELEAGLLRLEETGQDSELLNSIFRAAHSIKGGASTLGLEDIANFTHALEGLLDQLRTGVQPVTPGRIDLLLRARDILAGLLAAARVQGAPPPATGSVLDQLRKARVDEAPAVGPSNPNLCVYTLLFAPNAEVFAHGFEPMLLLRELAHVGEILESVAETCHLPDLNELVGDRCYLAWSILLRTDRPIAALEDIFVFVRDDCRLLIQPLSFAPPEPSCSVSEVRRRFGAYLIQRGLITADELTDVLQQQDRYRPHLEQLAIREGMLTVRQICDILDAMAGSGAPFRTVATRLGYLNHKQLALLIQLQTKQTPPLGELLVAAGKLSRAQMERELAIFHGDPVPEISEPEPAAQPEAESASACQVFQCENPELLGEFCTEAEEHLEAVDRQLLILENDPTNKEALNAVYRAFHTIKGVSSMFDLTDMRTLAHEAENLLNQARDGVVLLRDRAMDAAFASADLLKRQVGHLRDWLAKPGALPSDPDLPQLLNELRIVASPPAPDGSKPASPIPAADESKPASPIPPAADESKPASPTPPAADESKPTSPTLPAEEEQSEGKARKAATPTTATGDREIVRVDRSRLDKLINTIGELVIAQSMVQQEFDEQLNGHFHSRALPELNKIARDLQELSLSLRMVPLQGTFQKAARVVRDLSRKIGKPIHFELQGEDTELDKTVVDQLGDPLIHMVRNAVDHGIEPPQVRLQAGKPAQGRITLRAYHQGGNVYIELEDDGKGLDRQAIVNKAIERGLISDGSKLSDGEVFNLIFEPGFSTAKVVTEVSGRGVGMDVVRRNVEALQGNILIRSQLGKGTTFTIRLPLTLAIMDGLSVGLGDEVYILPLLSVVESFRPRRSELHRVAGRGEVVIVRGEVVPIVRLSRVLGRPARVEDPCAGLLVLVENQGKKHALLVDELLGQLQVVMKSLDVNYRKVEGISGATILGDGRVAMVLDVYGLTRLAEGCRGGALVGSLT